MVGFLNSGNCLAILVAFHPLSGSLPVLLDHLLDLFRASSLHRKEVVLLITHVLTGASCQGCAQGLGKVCLCT